MEERWRGETEREEVMSSGGVFCLWVFCFALLLFSIWSHLLIRLDIFTMNINSSASFLKIIE